jgi:hypothetical protein
MQRRFIFIHRLELLLTPIGGPQTGQWPPGQARRARHMDAFEIRNIGICRLKTVNVIERRCERDASQGDC